MIDVKRDVLDSRFLSSGRAVVENLSRSVVSMVGLDNNISSMIVDSVVSFSRNLPHQHDSLTSGLARLIGNLIKSGKFSQDDLRRLIEAHVIIVNLISAPKVIDSSSRTLAQLQRRDRIFMGIYADVIFASDLSCNFNALTAMLSYDRFLTEFRSKIIGAYIDHVIGGKQRAPSHTFEVGFLPLYGALTALELDSKVIPVINRMLKRAQASTLQIIVPLFRGLVDVPLDNYVDLLCPIIGTNIRLADPRRQKASRELFQIFSLKATSARTLQSLISELDSHLAGKREGIIANAFSRIFLIDTVSSLIRSPIVKDVAPQVVTVLQAQAQRETHDEGRVAALECLSKFLPLLPLPLPLPLTNFVAQTITKSGESKPEFVVGHLIVLVNIIRATGELPTSTPRSVVELILTCSSCKPQNRATALACLAVFVELQDAAIIKKYLLQPGVDSFALKVPHVLSSSPREAQLLVNIIDTIFQPFKSIKAWEATESHRSIFDALIYLMLRPERSIAMCAFASVKDFPQSCPELVRAFYELLYSRPNPESIPKLSPFSLSRILRRIAECSSLPTASFITASLIAHHPSLKISHRNRSGSSPWEYLHRKRSSFAPALFSDNIELLSEMIFSSDCLLSTDLDCFQSGISLIATVLQICPFCYEHIFARLQAYLDPTQIDSFSATDLAIFSLPDGNIAKIQSMAASTESTPKSSNRSKRMTDAEWAAEVQKEIDLKRQVPDSNEISNEITRQDGIRARIRNLLLPIQRALMSIRALCNYHQEQFAQTILSLRHSALLDAIYVLAPYSLVTVQVRQTLADIAIMGLEPRIGARSGELVAYASAVCAQLGVNALVDDSPVQKTVSDAITTLQQAMSARLFSGSTIRFLLPLFESAAASPSSSVSVQCMHILTAHASIADLPTDRLMSLSQSILSTPRGGADASVLLHGISTSLTDKRHLHCLLGDQGLLSSNSFSRKVSLEVLSVSPLLVAPHSNELVAFLYALCKNDDPDDLLNSIALRAWDKFEFQYRPIVPVLVPFLSHSVPWVRHVMAVGIGNAMGENTENIDSNIQLIMQLIRDSPDEMVQSQFDIDPREIDRSATRESGFAVFGAAASVFSREQISELIEFIVTSGFMDKKVHVWNQALKTGLELVNTEQGATYVPELQEILDRGLSRNIDSVSEGAIVLIGRLARFLDPKAKSDQVKSIFSRLLDALSIPSYAVQSAVADCIVPLAPMLQNDTQKQEAVDSLLKRAANGKTYGDRKGASLGLAGLVKGLRIASLKKFGVLAALGNLIQDKRAHSKQGALFCIEALFAALGKLFEPYIPNLIPNLLISFGDTASEVRDAAHDATRVMMAQVTVHGVKLMLPFILKALDDQQWRTKVESIGMLGSMAFCAPKQLCAFLPTVVPRLTLVLADPHPKVQEAAKKALAEIGSVIRNPEIQSLVPSLLSALIDPADNTRGALQQLLDTSFVNSVDAPSLALIVPIVVRGLHDRSPTIKRMAALIVGTMSEFLRDISAVMPYVDGLLGDLKEVLLDPIPDVRSSGARAMGFLFKGVGGVHFPNLVEWLLQLLRSNPSSVERNGASQGLAQVLAVRGLTSLSDCLDTILDGACDSEYGVREGFLEAWVYLPRSFGNPLHVHLSRILPTIINGLADDKEPVRSMALSAGKSLITVFGSTKHDIFFAILQKSIRNANWRIREHSCVLIGDVLATICGAQVSIVATDHIEFDVDDSRKLENEEMILSTLGRTERDTLFSDLFIAQADTVTNVQQTAWLVWKSIVAHTNRLLTDIMPVLMDNVIQSLSHQDFDRRSAAAKSLGSMVQRSGEIVLPVIIPIFEAGLLSQSPAVRQGVCFGISEVMSSAPKQDMTTFMAQLVPAIRLAICDENEMVRSAAATSFETLLRNTGPRAIADVVPPLVRQLSEESPHQSQLILLGLRQVLQVRSGPVLTHLIPSVESFPITPFYANALASLADVYGPSIDMHVDTLMPWYLNGIANTTDSTTYQSLLDAATTFVLGLHPDVAHSVVQCLCAPLNDRRGESSQSMILISTKLLGAWCAGSSSDYSSELESIMGALLSQFISSDELVLLASLESFNNAIQASDKADLIEHLSFLRLAIQRLARECGRRSKQDQVTIPGLCLPNAISGLLMIYQYGILNGPAEQRQLAASCLGDLVSLTTSEALKPYVIKITGPLIRIVGDRFPAFVKAAILTTLGLLLDRAGSLMKPFVPQLQATFTKNLQDPDPAVRDSAAPALASLLILAPRKVDALVQEVVGVIFEGDKEPMIRSMAKTLYHLLSTVGEAVSAELHQSIESALIQCLSVPINECRVDASAALGSLSAVMPADQAQSLFQRVSCPSSGADWEARHGAALACASVARRVGAYLDPSSSSLRLKALLKDSDPVVRGAALTLGTAIAASAEGDSVDLVVSMMIDASRDCDADVRLEFGNQMGYLGKTHPTVLLKRNDLLNQVVRVLLELSSDGSQSVSLSAQAALGHTLQLHRGRAHTFDAYLKTLDDTESAALDKLAKRSRLFRTSTE